MTDEPLDWETWAAAAVLTPVPALLRDLANAVSILGEHPESRPRDDPLVAAAGKLRTAADELAEKGRTTFDVGWHMGRAVGLLDAADADFAWRDRAKLIIHLLADVAAVRTPRPMVRRLYGDLPPPGSWIDDLAEEAERLAAEGPAEGEIP